MCKYKKELEALKKEHNELMKKYDSLRLSYLKCWKDNFMYKEALDKACEYLEDGYSNDCPSMEHPYKFDYPCRENEEIETKEQWKEWLLNGK